MGSVKFDLTSQEIPYKEYSFSSVEDIYDLLWKLDAIFDGAEKGNVEALSLKIDFMNLVEKCENEIIDEYISIQIGDNPLSVRDLGKNIMNVISERVNKTIDQCEEEFIEGINYILSNNKGKWLKCYRFNFKDQKVKRQKEAKCPERFFDGYEDLDYKKKYLFKRNFSKKLFYPNELNDIIDYRNINQEKMDVLEKKGSISKEEQDELKWRVNNKIKIDMDISEIKRSFDIKVGKTNTVGRSDDKVSFDDDCDYINNDDYRNKVYNEVSYYKILNVAGECLTDKQQIIFSLYFINGLSQNEISDVIDDTQGNISRDLSNIISKLIKNI